MEDYVDEKTTLRKQIEMDKTFLYGNTERNDSLTTLARTLANPKLA